MNHGDLRCNEEAGATSAPLCAAAATSRRARSNGQAEASPPAPQLVENSSENIVLMVRM